MTGKVQSLKQIRITNAGEKKQLDWICLSSCTSHCVVFLFYPSVGFQPAQILSNGDPMAPWAAAIFGLVPGYILYKRVVTVRGHEWHRVQALKKLSKHYKNEDSGVWENNQNITLRTTQGSVEVGALTQSALQKMQGKVGDLMMDNLDASAEIESKAEIDMLATEIMLIWLQLG